METRETAMVSVGVATVQRVAMEVAAVVEETGERATEAAGKALVAEAMEWAEVPTGRVVAVMETVERAKERVAVMRARAAAKKEQVEVERGMGAAVRVVARGAEMREAGMMVVVGLEVVAKGAVVMVVVVMVMGE